MSRYFVINCAGDFYTHKPGFLISWGPLRKANEFQTVNAASVIAEKHKGARVVEMKGKRVVEVSQ